MLNTWPDMALKRVVRFGYGDALSYDDREPGDVKVYGSNGPFAEHSVANTRAPSIVIGRKGSYGKIQFAGEPVFCVDTTFFVDERFTDQDLRFVYYLLDTLALDQGSADSAVPGLSRDKAYSTRIKLPPVDTQRRIAGYLDDKTARIDALIEKKRALLDRLAEKRQALITRAVTLGLNPDAPLKDSGIDWLGKVPAHWEVKRFRFLLQGIEQGWSPQCDNRQAQPDEWGVLKVGCVNGLTYDEGEHKALPSDLDPITKYEVRVGDVLLSRANTKELLGSASLVHETRGRMIFSDKLYRLSLADELVSAFAITVLQSPLARLQYERDATGTSGSMQNIGQDTIKNFIMPIPPRNEQIQIGQHVQDFDQRLSAIVAQIQDSEARLVEYRSALVTAAVTGKIKALLRGECKEAADHFTTIQSHLEAT